MSFLVFLIFGNWQVARVAYSERAHGEGTAQDILCNLKVAREAYSERAHGEGTAWGILGNSQRGTHA